MVFSKNDIILESSLAADITKISVACDMMIESFIDGSDEDTFEEAGGKAFDSIKSAVSAIIEKIKKFIQDSIKSIREKLNKNKIKNTIKDLDKMNPSDVIKSGPDVLKAYMLLKKYEDFVDKAISEIDNLVVRGFTKNQKMKNVLKYYDQLSEKSDPMVNEINAILNSKDRYINYTVATYKSILKLGLEIDSDYEKFSGRISQATDKLDSALISKILSYDPNAGSVDEYKIIHESAPKSTVNSDTPTLEEKKNGIMSCLRSIQSFVIKHKKAVIAITSTIVVATGAVIVYKKLPDKKLKPNKPENGVPNNSSSATSHSKIKTETKKDKEEFDSKTPINKTSEKPKTMLPKKPIENNKEMKNNAPKMNPSDKKSPSLVEQMTSQKPKQVKTVKASEIDVDYSDEKNVQSLINTMVNTTVGYNISKANGDNDGMDSFGKRMTRAYKTFTDNIGTSEKIRNRTGDLEKINKLGELSAKMQTAVNNGNTEDLNKLRSQANAIKKELGM